MSQPDVSTEEGRRDLVLLVILYDTVARVKELIDLKIKDVRLSSPSVITLHGKGNKIRQVPITGRARTILESYMEHPDSHKGISEGDQYVFVNQRGQHLSRWGVSYIINKYAERASRDPGFQIKFPVTPHVFRNPNFYEIQTFRVNSTIITPT